MPYVIQLILLVSGRPDPAEGLYVQHYDPGTYAGIGFVETTSDIDEARRFSEFQAALDYYRQPFGMRPDGQPNRPLTAWTIEIWEKLE